jgi:hypothetical protein
MRFSRLNAEGTGVTMTDHLRCRGGCGARVSKRKAGQLCNRCSHYKRVTGTLKSERPPGFPTWDAEDDQALASAAPALWRRLHDEMQALDDIPRTRLIVQPAVMSLLGNC